MKKIIAILSAVTLSACSNSPTESDAKEVIKNALNGCGIVSLVSLKKINGIADGNKYQVAIDYSLKILPPSNAESIRNQITSITAEIDQRLQAARKEAVSAEESYKAVIEKLREHESESNTISDAASKASVDAANNAIANHCKAGSECANQSSEISQKAYKDAQIRKTEFQALVAKRDESMAKMDTAKNSVKTLEVELYKANSFPMNGFAKECPNIGNSIRRSIAEASEKFEASNPGKNAYLAGFVADLTGTVNFIKTDNGWKSGL